MESIGNVSRQAVHHYGFSPPRAHFSDFLKKEKKKKKRPLEWSQQADGGESSKTGARRVNNVYPQQTIYAKKLKDVNIVAALDRVITGSPVKWEQAPIR